MKYYFLIILLSVTFVSCKKEATVWQSDWNAPLVNDTLSLSNLVNDSTLSTTSGYYAVDLTRTLFDLSINDIVSIPDTTIQRNYPSQLNFEIQPNTTFAGSVETYYLELDDIQLKLITLQEGFIDVRVENPIETKAYFIVKLPGVTKNGVVFQHTLSAPAANNSGPGIKVETLNLSGYTLDLKGIDGGGYNELLADFSVLTDPNGSPAMITTADVTRVKATIRDMRINYAQGYFGNRVLTDNTTIDIAELDVYESGAVDISNLSLTFEVENGVKVGAIATILSVSNENVNGSVVNLTGSNLGMALTVNPATGSWGSLASSLTIVAFNASNSNIEAYLENMGTKHTVGYSFQINPWGNVSGGWDQIFPNSRIRVKLHAQMPLAIGMDNLVIRDTFDIDLNQNPEKTRIISGDLILNARNGFPFRADITLHLLDANGALLHTVSGSEPIESAQYGTLDAATGVMVQASQVIFSLGDHVIADINDVKKIVVKSKFNSPNPLTGTSQVMLVPENAFIGVKLKSMFKTENKF